MRNIILAREPMALQTMPLAIYISIRLIGFTDLKVRISPAGKKPTRR